MREIIKTKDDLCTGCNRCVRECPMETANITYQNENSRINVRIDQEKCITCGHCITACKHDVRYFEDDTSRFINDLSNGVSISVIAAPAIKTNIPDYKRLFTYLKQLGVKNIYDVSLGADICVWAHIRHLENTGHAPLIAQPCPAIVNYCEIYRHDLLGKLSPIHSPMGCISIYMKEYEGITDRIAALSPCIAKSNEFVDTGLAHYNVTFSKLLEYLEKNNVQLPEEETEFSHIESGIGSLFPVPGGLKENIEFFLGKSVSIDRAEGSGIYDDLKMYAESPQELLPQIFDVLNCHAGCNIGTACTQSANIFGINRTMDNIRSTAMTHRDREYFETAYKSYDNTLTLSHFMREYRPISTQFPEISEEDIEKAFERLGKTDNEKQHVDCGACGSETCYGMARKIALGVNIPTNCIVMAMETARHEHEQLMLMEQVREADERMRIMFETTPFCAQFWDKNLTLIDCNQATLRLFGVAKKQEYLERFNEFSPEYQPDGSLSKDKSIGLVKQAFADGWLRFEWMCQSRDGEQIPAEVTLVRAEYKGDNLVVAYVRDLRGQKRMMQELDTAAAKLKAVISNYSGVIWSVDRGGVVTLFDGLYLKEIGVTPDFVEGKHLDVARQKNRHLDIIENVQKTFDEGSQDWISDIDGKMFHVHTSPIHDESGNATGVVGSIDEITEMLQLQKKLEFALADAENANHALKSAQLTTSAMFEASPYINILFNSDFEIIDCNPIAVQFLGFNTKEEILTGFMERITSSIPPFQSNGMPSVPLTERFAAVAKEGHIKFETELNLGGRLRSLSVEFKKIPYEKSFAVVAYVFDITESLQLQKELKSALEDAKAANHALKSAQLTTAAMFEANPHINMLFNSKLEVIDCNPAAVQFMRFGSKEELLAGFAERMASAIPPIQPDGRVSRPMTDLFATAAKEGVFRFETNLTFGNGFRTLNVELKRIPYEGSYAIVAYLYDITDIREREKELLHARELNEFQLLKLNLAVKATKIGLWDMEILDTEQLLSHKNTFTWTDEFRHLLGFTDENDFPNVFQSWDSLIHPEDKPGTREHFKTHLMDKTGQTPCDMEYRSFKKNGECAYFRASGEAIRDEEGNPIRMAGSLMDITATKNILIETERQRLEAEAANQAKSAFLSTMSHEIRTPMNAILGITEIQLQNETLDKNIREAFDKIYSSGDMLLGIINDILDLSKIEAGKLELMNANYETASLISDTAQLNMMRIGSKPIEFELYVEENAPVLLWGDELRVKQILNNLLSNAFKYTATGMVTLSIAIDNDSNDDNNVVLIFRVTDTGQGMTPEQVDRLFDEYSRFNFDANRETEGTGLGMSITRNLIRLMGGEIFVESEAGKGSTFTVRLPQGRVGSGVLGKEVAENLQRFRTSSRAQMRRVQIAREYMPYGTVLVVDDVEINIYVAKGLLASYGLKFNSAESGFEAIEKIKNGNKYDVVFMDHMMPKMDGIEATKIIRSMGYKQPIVALTANAVAGQADIFLGNGFDDFISKPIDVRQLNAVLNKFVRDKQPPEVIESARRQQVAKNELASGILKQQAGMKDGLSSGILRMGIDPKFAEIFVRDVRKSIAVLDVINNKGGIFDEEDIRTYTIYVHGMKSALANIGNMELSAVALKLEMSAREGDTAVMASETSAFLDELRAVVEELTPQEDTDAEEAVDEDRTYLHTKLLAIKTACEEYNEQTAEEIIATLHEKTWSSSTKELLNTIAEHLLHSDFDEIVELVAKFTETK